MNCNMRRAFCCDFLKNLLTIHGLCGSFHDARRKACKIKFFTGLAKERGNMEAMRASSQFKDSDRNNVQLFESIREDAELTGKNDKSSGLRTGF